MGYLIKLETNFWLAISINVEINIEVEGEEEVEVKLEWLSGWSCTAVAVYWYRDNGSASVVPTTSIFVSIILISVLMGMPS